MGPREGERKGREASLHMQMKVSDDDEDARGIVFVVRE